MAYNFRQMVEIRRQVDEASKASGIIFEEQPALSDHYTYRQAATYVLRWANSYSRMEMMLSLQPRMARASWLRLLGEEWSHCDNIFEHAEALRVVLGTAGPVLHMMSAEEKRAYAELPEIVTIYRGCGADNINGASWSVNKAVARKFPFLNRYSVTAPLLVTAQASKQNILAAKLNSDEQEVITFNARVTNTKPIKERRTHNHA